MQTPARKTLKALDASAYGPAFQDARVFVWLNPPPAQLLELIPLGRSLRPWLAKIAAMDAVALAAWAARPVDAGEAMQMHLQVGELIRWLARDIWSEDPDGESIWSAAEIHDLYARAPSLFHWLAQQTFSMIEAAVPADLWPGRQRRDGTERRDDQASSTVGSE